MADEDTLKEFSKMNGKVVKNVMGRFYSFEEHNRSGDFSVRWDEASARIKV